MRRLFKGIAVLLVLGLLAGAWRGDIKWREWVVDQDWATDIEWPDWLNMGVDGDYDLDDFDQSVSSTVSAFLQYAETRQEALEVLEAGANGDEISQASAVDRVFGAWGAVVEELTLFGLVADSVDELNESSAHTGEGKNAGLPDGLAVSGFTSLASSASDSSTLLLAQAGDTDNCPTQTQGENALKGASALSRKIGSLGLADIQGLVDTLQWGREAMEAVESIGQAAKDAGMNEDEQLIVKNEARLALIRELGPVFINAVKGQGNVFGAFVGLAIGKVAVATAVPVLTAVAIGGAATYLVGAGFEYLFFSDTAKPSDPRTVVAGITDVDGKVLLPKDQCGTLVIKPEKGSSVVATQVKADDNEGIEIQGLGDQSSGNDQNQTSTTVQESAPTCSEIGSLNHRFQDLGNGKIRVEVSNPKLTGCLVTFSGRIVNEFDSDKSQAVDKSFTAPGAFEVNGPSAGSFKVAGTLSSGQVSLDIEHRVIQKGPRIDEMQLTEPSETIKLDEALNLGNTPLRVTYENGRQTFVLATALGSEIRWSQSNGPGTLQGDTYIADEAGTAALVVTYLSGASSISQTLTVTVEGSQIPEEENQTEVIPSEDPLNAEASFRAVGKHDYDDSWFENTSQALEGMSASVGLTMTLNEIEILYSAESGEVSGEFKTDYFYDMKVDLSAQNGPSESCRLTFISSAFIDAKASSYSPATGVLQGSTDEYLLDVDVVADSAQSGYCQALVTQLKAIAAKGEKSKFSGKVENGSIRGQIEPIQNPYGSPPVLFSLTVVDSE